MGATYSAPSATRGKAIYILCLPILKSSQIFLEATKKISQSKIPLLHEVIPIVDIITRALDDFVDDITKFPVVRAAARRGRAMMNKYYSLTDDSVMYRIAMCKWRIRTLTD
jgi:hypothetical protein